MTNEKSADTAPKNPETTTPIPEPSGQKARPSKKTGRSKKTVATDEVVSVTFTFDPEFARHLKMVTAATGESAGSLLQRIVWPVLRKEVQRLLKEMSGS